MGHELVIPRMPAQVMATDAGAGLLGWLLAYGHAEVAGAPKATVEAKRRDFQLFLNYFATMMRSDAIDDWTRSVTLGFVAWLENEASGGRGYAPTSVNRTMATLRRAARWIQARRPFLAGDPFERVSDLIVTIPPAKGLSPLQRRRALAAADKLVAHQAQRNQQPRRKRALLVVLLETGMRISETLRLSLDQYDGKYFRNVKRNVKPAGRRLRLARGEGGPGRLLRPRAGQGARAALDEPRRHGDAPEGRWLEMSA